MLKAVYCVTEHTKCSRVSTRSIFYQVFVYPCLRPGVFSFVSAKEILCPLRSSRNQGKPCVLDAVVWQLRLTDGRNADII